ncbi:glutamine-hydrolyzing carbamoyl-phosphate synthase small subunit [soil metagenome]
MTHGRAALLALEDGTVFRGVGFGAELTTSGEICFNTSMTGYQEVLTDPSYHGQIVAMTATQIGNTGWAARDDQSARPWAAGFVVRELSPTYSSWRAECSLHDHLKGHGVAAIAEVDTRRLTRHIRAQGAMRAALSTAVTTADDLVDIARCSPAYAGRDLVAEVSTPAPYCWSKRALIDRAGLGSSTAPGTSSMPRGRRTRVAALDFGVKRNLLDQLVASGCDVTVLPAGVTASSVLDGGYDGVFLSNGPGDPQAVPYAVSTVAALLGRVPIFGICLGHQMLALALGATTYKLPFGHRGGNHPVKRMDAPRVEITCQNHGFAVDRLSLDATDAIVTHTNLNDRTVEGIDVPGVAFGVQYHPEAAPGPHDSRYLFARFTGLMAAFEPGVRALQTA